MYSMTGYGKGEAKRDGRTLTVELKTVNHRFLDFGLKLPRTFLFLEDSIKKAVSSAISRGHIDLYITYERQLTDSGAYVVDAALANDYLSAARKLALETGVEDDLKLTSLLKVSDVLRREQVEDDEDMLRALMDEALAAALENLKAMRAKEGLSLKADISSKLNAIEAQLDVVKQLAPTVIQNYKAGLEARIAEVLEPSKVDAQRLATEVALYADHCAIDEEISRLGAHIAHMRALLDESEPVGRKMDFLVQEFNREANTMGSKANDMRITNCVLAIKNEIEKMREQAANIE